MLEIGKMNKLKIKTFVPSGCYLGRGADNVFMIRKDIPQGAKKGDELDVFVYNDSKTQIRATTQKPYAQVGEFCYTVIKEITHFGFFLDWGIGKDLFLPIKYVIGKEWKPGNHILVYLSLDFEKQGVIGIADLKKTPDRPAPEWERNTDVSALVYGMSDIGYKVIIDQKYRGMIYKNETAETLKLGKSYRAFVKKVREDGLVDVSVRKQGFRSSIDEDVKKLEWRIRKEGGFLDITDRSSADVIKKRLGISKKVFKRTVGVMLKRGVIRFEKNGITLVKGEKQSPSSN